jgi:KEOPS complex subunit Cgi121
MDHTRLLFGKPLIKDSKEFISAVRDLQARTGCTIQAFDADKVASERHLIFAIEKAFAAFSEERNIAKDLGVEVLRYASGERQIERALLIGVSGSTKRVALAIIRPELAGPLVWAWPDSSELSRLIEVDGMGASFKLDALRETFNISEDEIRAADETRIPDLVLERVALVDTIR